MEKTREHLKETLKNLPDSPGIYKFFSKEGDLIYVGKAKNLKKRVSNYFNNLSGRDNKTRKLVSQIHIIEYTIVNSEFDAYLLENNLIKSNKPKFNILLRDDKTYPYLYLSYERFPRLISTRKRDRTKGKFFGPYTSVKAMNTVMDLIQKLFALRTCSLNLVQSAIEQKKFKVCLEYHIGNCKAPCESLISEDEYNQGVEKAEEILKGNLSLVKNSFRDEMIKASENLEFEKAQAAKEKLDLLEKFQASSIVVSPTITDLDVITLASTDALKTINFLMIKNGVIIKTKTLQIQSKLHESNEEILSSILISLKEDLESPNTEILSNMVFESPENSGYDVVIPKIGDKKKLVNLSYNNALFELNKIRIKEESQVSHQERVLLQAQKDLQLKSLPLRIECFDNSNIQGTNPVAAMVCFLKGQPAKKEYRHFNIKTVTGPDDFLSMEEIVTRRYKRLLEEKSTLPNLIVIDGGKGQLNAACNALKKLNLYGTIPVIGIAKRLEEIYYPEDSLPLYLDKRSSTLKLIQHIRNEAHRFAITFHRKKRSQEVFQNEVSQIPGIGKKTYERLIRNFKSLKKVREASMEEIAAVVGNKKAELIKKTVDNK